MINYLDKHILEANVDIIAHHLNCLGKLNDEISNLIIEKHPSIEKKIEKYCKKNKRDKALGTCLFTKPKENKDILIASLFGQSSIDLEIKEINYTAFENALLELKDYAKKKNLKVGMAYGNGCENSKVEWDIINNMIDRAFFDYSIEICKENPMNNKKEDLAG